MCLVSLAMISMLATAAEFPKLDEALPSNGAINDQHPVFDFDTDGCYPEAGISRSGEKNPGLSTSGSITSGCRNNGFLNTANTLHRYACIDSAGSIYCGHFYALYFEKDQVWDWWDPWGHRHDWEYVAVWTTNGHITHGSYSSHGDLVTSVANQLQMQGNNIKFVYHKDGLTTHAMRFAGTSDTVAENIYGYWVTPTITSWYELTGDGISNQQMRNYLNSYDYGTGTIPLKDSNFQTNLNAYKPAGYPTFTQQSIEASNPNP